jgi:hypothetical protein
MADFEIKENDTLPKIQYQLQDSVGNINLTGATVLFIMSLTKGGTPKVAAAATITAPTTGMVEYQWLAADTDTPNDPDDEADVYLAEWQVTIGGQVITVPNDGYITVRIIPDLNSELG